MEQKIQDWTGKIIGYIETKSDGSKIVRDFYRRIVGRYNPKSDYTEDFYGRRLYKGDQSSLLLK